MRYANIYCEDFAMNRLLLLAFCISAASLNTVFAQYQCANAYNPSDYIGNTRVPTDCKLQPLDCPRSWKSGAPQGQLTDLPLIDVDFVQCHEGFLCCGYIPIDSTTGQVLGTSGVTVGSGVDLGSKTGSSLTSIGVAQTIADKLEPYYGLKQGDAACAAIELPLDLACSDAQALTEAVKNDIVSQVQNRYEQDRKADADSFIELPRGIRTAIADVWFQFGFPTAYPNFWKHVTNNDWENTVTELRNFYGPGANPPSGDLKRRNNEADIIEATLAKCNRSVDIFFLLDESGSISSGDFSASVSFIESIIDAYPNEALQGENGTRFGLSLFSSNYRSAFYLSYYKSKSMYFNAISSVNQVARGTNLGTALLDILGDQFTIQNGLRPENFGFPKILIVMTDGESSDEVSEPAANVHKEDIVIYAIGIGNYDTAQLNAIASSAAHVHTLSTFSDLSGFAATLTASTCYEPQPITFGTEINGQITKDQFQYYSYNVNERTNLKVKTKDIKGSTVFFCIPR